VITHGDVAKTIHHSLMAEKSDFDTVTLPDHLFHPLMKDFLTEPPWEVFTVLAAIGFRTRKIKIMPAVADPVRRRPVLLAHATATLDHLTGGRAMLGLGAGEAFNISPLEDAKWDKPYTRLEEAVSLVKMFWASSIENPVTFRGEYFSVKDVFLSFKPLQKPRPPVYIGGYGPKIRRLVGLEGDGWLPLMYTPELYKRDLKLIIKTAKKAGREPKEIDPALMASTVILPDSDKARKTAINRNRIVLALRPRLLKNLGFRFADEEISWFRVAFTNEQKKILLEIANKIPDEIVEKVVIAGSTDDAIEQIEDYVKSGVKHFIITPPIPWFEETVEAYKKEIIPYFRTQD
jgi:alkanesulfonate monooxygenase SsuD/methylene tetrahydromethanopterin reductase-like flavin-dependent oxidoreductase (luciferase family)